MHNSALPPMHVADDPNLDAQIEQWFHWDKNEVTNTEIQNFIKAGNVEELRKRLMGRLKFGTAGLRGQMGAGFAMMNDLTVIQTTQGLLRYLQKEFYEELNVQKKGVVIGYDGRHNSHRFSWLTANIFIKADIPVHWYSRMCPTPFVPFAVKHYGCVCGVMITASHNPKKDNGYKVYWNNGAQIIPPHDEGIAEHIAQHLPPWNTSWDLSGVDTSALKHDPLADVMTEYYKQIVELSYCQELLPTTTLKFAYTAMHGVGYHYVQRAMQAWGLPDPVPVPTQVEPDPEFPTVKYPNPEEGKGALLLAMATAEQHNCNVILANDPDVDRFAVAERQDGGNWKIFTGNETGALFGWWVWHNYRLTHPDTDAKDVYMLSSTVSSKILRTMSEKHGFQFTETLTGFKWMGNETSKLIAGGNKVLFAFEEAIGFMVGSVVLDKDGISALCCMAEMACYLYDQGLTLSQQLNKIYQEYGFHLSHNSYYICYEPDIIHTIFNDIRNSNTANKYPYSCGGHEIKSVRDLTVGYDSSNMWNTPSVRDLTVGYDSSNMWNTPVSWKYKSISLPVDPSSEMITLVFYNGCEVTLRTSGTEPKIKYYSEMVLSEKSEYSHKEATQIQKEVVSAVINELLRPDKYSHKEATQIQKEVVGAVISELLRPDKYCLVPKPEV